MTADDNMVQAYPGAGAAVGARSEYGPIEVTMHIGAPEGEGPVRGDASEFHSWRGEVEFADDEFFVSSFDQFPENMSQLRLPSGSGRYELTAEWTYGEHKDGADHIDDFWERVKLIII